MVVKSVIVMQHLRFQALPLAPWGAALARVTSSLISAIIAGFGAVGASSSIAQAGPMESATSISFQASDLGEPVQASGPPSRLFLPAPGLDTRPLEGQTRPLWVSSEAETLAHVPAALGLAAAPAFLDRNLAPFPLGRQHFPRSLAQVQDLEDRFLQPGSRPAPLDSDPEEPLREFEFEAPPSARDEAPEAGQILVRNLSLVGSTIFSEADLAPLVEPYLGQPVSEAALQSLADAITERYLEQGYITSRAVLDPDSLPSGDIRINILEGSVESIEIEGLERLNAGYVRDRLWLAAGPPLNTGRLEDQLRLLRASPVIETIEASLRTGSSPVQSLLVVRVTEAKRLYNTFSADNYSPPSVGSERLGYTFSHINLTGYADELRFDYRRTTPGGSDTIDFLYRRPLNPMDGTLQVRTSVNWNRVILPPFDILNISGKSQLYELSYRQPLIKTPREELALSFGFTYQTGQTFTFAGPTPFGFGPGPDGSTTTSVFKFGQDYLRRDPTGAWALRSQFSFGTGLFGATSNPDQIPDSHFRSWLVQAQRVQVINRNNFLIAALDFQYATDPLLPSQQFVIGGGQSVRGFRQNVRAADNGLRFSVENRMTLSRDETGNSVLVLAPFLDLGMVWNAQGNPNSLPPEKFIAGIGLGMIWEVFPGLTVRFDYGYPIINLADRGRNAQDNGVYFSAVYQF